MNRALFIDRDGILNELVDREGILSAPRNWDEVRFCPELDEVSSLGALGFRLILVTNQPDVERGLVETKFVDELHQLYRKKHQLDAIYFCPYSDTKHPFKKPNPGMFLKAAEDFELSLPQCFHLGDTSNDVGAAEKSGCLSILWDRPYNTKIASQFRISSVSELKHLLISTLPHNERQSD